MSRTAARLARAEQATHQRTLAELRRRRGWLRFVVYARDAEPHPDFPGYWRSETADMITDLPPALNQQALDIIDFLWTVEPEPESESDET